VRAVFNVEDGFEQTRPTQARLARPTRVAQHGRVYCAPSARTRHAVWHSVRARSLILGASAQWKRIRCKRGR
jgi:hypothetical protein